MTVLPETVPRARTLVVLEPGRALPDWAARVGAEPLPAAALDGADAARRLEGAECLLLPADGSGFVGVARRAHHADAALQVVAVVRAEATQAARRALLYAPGLGEVWLASPGEVTAALEERAAGVTRQRRRFERTRARTDLARATASPQRTERALISDAYLAGLLQVLPDAVFSVDETGRVLSANQAAERAFARAHRSVVGARLGDLLAAAGERTGDAALLRRAAGPEPLELEFVTADGERRTGELRAARLAATGPAGWAVVLRDVSAQRAALEHLRDATEELEAANEELQSTTEELMQRTEEAERVAEALRQSEEGFRALADAIPTLAWTARADGYIDWYNRRWYEYTGTTPQEMEGWGWQSVHDPAVLPHVVERWTTSIREGRPFEMTFPLRGADGRFRPFLTRIVPVRDVEERIVRWFGTNTDVESERASRQRVERLQALTEALAATQTIEQVAEVAVANAVQATGARTGMLAMRAPGKDEAVVVRQTGLTARVMSRYARFPLTAPGPAAECIRTGRPIFVETTEGPEGLLARLPGTEELWESLGTRALATVPLVAAGETVGAMSYTFDEPRRFTPEDREFFLALGRQCAQAVERARLFAAEREARRQADEANRAKSQFLANMSHELRTPLNAIAGYAQLIDEGVYGPVADAQRQALVRIRRAQQHLLGLINDVLNFAKLESGRVEYDLRALDVAELVADVAPLMAPQLAQRQLAFEAREASASGEAIRVCADRDKARQVLLNLLSNAAKFTAAGGRVRLDAEPLDDDRVAIRVRDTGRGIPAERLEAIFEPFVQVRPHYGSSHEGTGLGLAISRDLARGMGGDLTVESTLGEGSTFSFVLPRA